MSLYTRLVSGLLFPLHEALKGHRTVAVRRWMEATQWWDQERLRALQLERLRALLRRAWEQVPYYRPLLEEAGLEGGRIERLEDLARLPFLTKTVIRERFAALRARDARGLRTFNTGGSTGEPLQFLIGTERVSHDVAAKWRATRWWGVDVGDREAVVWGSPIELGAQDRIRAMRDAVLRTRLYPAFEMSEARMDAYLEALRRQRPAMVFGYPSSIELLAAHARRRGVRLDDVGVRVVFTTAETLYPHQREAIAEAFGCPVANGYGGRDSGFIAHECPEGGMHLTAEDIVLELVDAEGRAVPLGEPGEVVVTHLATGDFPFVRYRTGDVAVLGTGPCPCGRGLPVLKEVQGRTTDFIVARDGTVMHALALIYVLRELPGVASFRIVQESLDRTVVEVVPGEGYGESVRGRIREGIAARLGEGVEVVVREVAAIPRTRSGKHRYVESRVGGFGHGRPHPPQPSSP